MAEIDIFTQDGAKSGRLDLADAVFDAPRNDQVVRAALLRQLANQRAGTAATKTRGDVSGGGKKPWRQKGTGRARQGSTRAPQWKGGGVVWGPHPRSYEQKMPRKARQLALRVALSGRAREGRLIAVDQISLAAPKTKELLGILDRIGAGASTLIIVEQRNWALEKSAQNLPEVKVLISQLANVADILKYDYVVATQSALTAMADALTPANAVAVEAE